MAYWKTLITFPVQGAKKILLGNVHIAYFQKMSLFLVNIMPIGFGNNNGKARQE